MIISYIDKIDVFLYYEYIIINKKDLLLTSPSVAVLKETAYYKFLNDLSTVMCTLIVRLL